MCKNFKGKSYILIQMIMIFKISDRGEIKEKRAGFYILIREILEKIL